MHRPSRTIVDPPVQFGVYMAQPRSRNKQPVTSDKKKEVTSMTGLKVNFKATTLNFPARPAGDYEATFMGHLINPASANSGQPTVKLTWAEKDNPNKKIMRTYSLQPQALQFLKRDMIHMGASIEDMNAEDADLDDILNSLIGASNIIVMGEPRLRVTKQGEPVINQETGEQYIDDNFNGIKDPNKL